jgi:multisubunit Na+/H+ antiporter MnhB subunit
MTYAWYDIVGTVGVATIIAAYILLQTRRLRSENPVYSILNAAGASVILVSLYFSFNLPSFIVEFFWLLISLFGIGKYLMQKP